MKISSGREAPKCEWLVDGEKIEDDDKRYKCKSDKNTFELSILHFDSQLEGKYECVMSTAEEPTLSTAVEVTGTFNFCGIIGISGILVLHYYALYQEYATSIIVVETAFSTSDVVHVVDC